MSPPSRKAIIASALLGALVTAPAAYVLSGGSALGAAIDLFLGAAILAGVRRAAGTRLWLVALSTLIAVMIGGPLLLTIAVQVSQGTGNAGFAGMLFVIMIAGQLVAIPLGIVVALLHTLVARYT